MQLLSALIQETRIAYYAWALREIDPRHPDAHLVWCRYQKLTQGAHRRPGSSYSH